MALRQKKKVLITGGTGFIGSNFVYKFLALGYDVHLLVRSESNFWRIAPIKKKVKLHYTDLCNAEEVNKLIKKLKPQIILHFAAYGVYQRKQQDIALTINTNLLGTINLVNALSKIKFDCFIYTGSFFEYGIKNKPMKETDILEPVNLYGITKAAGTMYCQYMSRKLNLPIVITRLSTVYGYFEDKDRLIPTIIKSNLTNTELNLSNPNFVRDFIFIEDIIDAYLKAIKKIKKIKGEIFNLGTGKQTKIDEVVNLVKKLAHSYIEPCYEKVAPTQLEPKICVADISKAKKLLNWKPRYNLEKGLRKGIDWFKKNIYIYETE
jgi:nucleoside-diphosphate-sugar epimerase